MSSCSKQIANRQNVRQSVTTSPFACFRTTSLCFLALGSLPRHIGSYREGAVLRGTLLCPLLSWHKLLFKTKAVEVGLGEHQGSLKARLGQEQQQKQQPPSPWLSLVMRTSQPARTCETFSGLVLKVSESIGGGGGREKSWYKVPGVGQSGWSSSSSSSRGG